MNVYLPIIDETLVSSASLGETNFYLRPIPVWPTRSYTITITPEDPAKDVEISILQGGVNKFLKTIPYSPKIEFDLSIMGTIINPLTRDQSLINGGGNDLGLISIAHNRKYCMAILFNADVPVHMMPAIGGTNFKFPVKPRIPGQPYDIIMPSLSWENNGLTNYDIICEPVDDYHGPHVFPTKYYLGSTIDIRYIKKLTVKSPSTRDTVAVAEYENKLPEVVENDDQMICAARLRWNMRNGQWMWYAFKDYFWNEGFTYMRGLGGASEQGILTINVAYAKEFYPAFQELLVSSNIELTLPKQFPTIDEEQRYKMEVTSDTGARWSGSERVYRQQITLRTIGFMDNYIPPVLPDSPAPIPVQFRAYRNPWSIAPEYSEGLLNNVTCNSAWEVQSTPDWLFVGEMVTLTAADFEQGGLTGTAGTDYGAMKIASVNHVRSKNVIQTDGKPLLIRAFVPGYSVAVFRYDADSKSLGAAVITAGADATLKVNAAGDVAFIAIRLNRISLTTITPTDATAARIGVIKSELTGKMGTTHITATVQANTGAQRTANLVLKSLAGGATYTIPVTQAAGV